MINLSLDRINAKSPYPVRALNKGYEFTTNKGINYRIRFLEEDKIGGCDTYQFVIYKLNDQRSPHDPNISAVTFLVLDEFFKENNSVLLYYCDTTDHREAGRNRLFIRWFEKSADPDRFTIKSAHAVIEEQGIYVAIIVENRNPLIQQITDYFDKAAASLTDNKPK